MMYCRTCGNKIHDNAEICVKCGVKKNVGIDYCQVCGASTNSSMITCEKCGAKLMKAMSLIEMKKKAVSKSKKTLGTVLLVIGILLLIAMVGNVVADFMSSYSSFDNSANAGRCGVFGAFFTGLGFRLRKEQ